MNQFRIKHSSIYLVGEDFLSFLVANTLLINNILSH